MCHWQVNILWKRAFKRNCGPSQLSRDANSGLLFFSHKAMFVGCHQVRATAINTELYSALTMEYV